MPVNPMQRRIRNSFLGGFLVALIIMALVVAALIFKMKQIQEEKDQLLALQKTVYVAAEDLESGKEITIDSFVQQKVQSTVDVSQIVNDDDFSFIDEEGEVIVKYNKDGSEKQKKVVIKVDVPAGTIVTKDMIADSTEELQDDLRIQEFNMIILPSELKTGDYVDIRWSLPQGQDYIVLAKKEILKCTETGIWLKLSEDEILTINNAIVESYQSIGSKLYAIKYNEPGIQDAAEPTYPVNDIVLNQIGNNPNIVQEAKDALYNRYYANEMFQATQRTTYINPAITSNPSQVESKNQAEISKIQSAREEYLEMLEE